MIDQREAALKPCPFCGHETVEILGRGDVHWGRCDAIDCGTAGPIRHVEADAIAAWNRRAHAPPTEAEVGAAARQISSDHPERWMVEARSVLLAFLSGRNGG